MKRWDLSSLPASTEKQHPREPRSDAPRAARLDRQIPRVLFSAPECRAVVVELGRGEQMGDHHVRERVIVHVSAGCVEIEASGEIAECGAGTVATFAPRERHSVRALERSTLLLILAPWPAAQHYTESEADHAQRLPANAAIDPIEVSRDGS